MKEVAIFFANIANSKRYIVSYVFFYIMKVTDPLSNSLKFEETIKSINEEKFDITRFSLLQYCHLYFFWFFLLRKTKGLLHNKKFIVPFSMNS